MLVHFIARTSRFRSLPVAHRNLLGAVRLRCVHKISILNQHVTQPMSSCTKHRQKTHKAPSARAASICALVPGQLVDEYALVPGLVDRARTAVLTAWGVRRAVGLRRVLQNSALIHHPNRQLPHNTTGSNTYCGPTARARRIGTLVPGEIVDEHTLVVVAVLWASARCFCGRDVRVDTRHLGLPARVVVRRVMDAGGEYGRRASEHCEDRVDEHLGE